MSSKNLPKHPLLLALEQAGADTGKQSSSQQLQDALQEHCKNVSKGISQIKHRLENVGRRSANQRFQL